MQPEIDTLFSKRNSKWMVLTHLRCYHDLIKHRRFRYGIL